MKKLLLLFAISITLVSCEKEIPSAKPDYGAYYTIDRATGFFGYPGDGIYYRAALSWDNSVIHPSGEAKLTFDVVNNGKARLVEISWKFVASAVDHTYTYLTWTTVQPIPGDCIVNEKFDIRYD